MPLYRVRKQDIDILVEASGRGSESKRTHSDVELDMLLAALTLGSVITCMTTLDNGDLLVQVGVGRGPQSPSRR